MSGQLSNQCIDFIVDCQINPHQVFLPLLWYEQKYDEAMKHVDRQMINMHYYRDGIGVISSTLHDMLE